MEQCHWDIPGGHRRQAEKTIEYLRLLGVQVDLSFDPKADMTGYDVVHMFTPKREFLENARRQKKPIAMSSIYWSSDYTLNYHRIGGRRHWFKTEATQRLRAAWLALRHGNAGVQKLATFWLQLAEFSYAARLADVVLPNAHAEGDDLVRECGILPERVHFVPNAVETSVMSATPAAFIEKYGVKDFVLCVGRGEPRKNQLRLIEAVRGTGLPLVIVDPVHPHHGPYRAQCKAAMQKAARHNHGAKMLYLESLSDDMLMSAYHAAKVHALPSFYETTGLVSLEAALADCNLVVNEQPHTREYFTDIAWYCDPYKTASIRAAVLAAMQAPVNPAMKQRVLDHFTWEHTARATLDAYNRIVGIAPCAGPQTTKSTASRSRPNVAAIAPAERLSGERTAGV